MSKAELLAGEFLEVYTLEEILELADITEQELVELLIRQGLLDPELPHGVS